MQLQSTADLPALLANSFFWAAIGLAAGFSFLFRGFTLLRRRKLILNTPRSTVRGAAMGPVEISGKAVGPYTLISPLSAVDCYYYRARAWQSNQHSWKKIAEETLYAPFFVDDGTGHLLVDPRGAETDLPAIFSHEYSTSQFDSELIPDYISHFLRRHGISSDMPLKLEENCIVPGDTLFVLGTLQENPRLEMASGPSVSSSRQSAPAFVSRQAADLQRRGELEFLDIAAQNSLTSHEVASEASQFDLNPPVILGKSARDPFFLSWCSEREVALNLQWQIFLYLWCGPVFTLAGLWLLIASLQRK